ncbi:nucleotidyltransferase domain-containing protein [Candidatus Peregrinibacteria bacterium]|nr:nucleotidyltransferase domain-containing protein [Candidatus Peregrinibacteria bacterium]
MKAIEAIGIARRFRKKLNQKRLPIQQVLLFGSAARGNMHEHSDIDIAIVCMPFLDSKHEENVEFLLMSKDIDLRIETVCLHPEDLRNKYFTLAQEVKRYGIPV